MIDFSITNDAGQKLTIKIMPGGLDVLIEEANGQGNAAFVPYRLMTNPVQEIHSVSIQGTPELKAAILSACNFGGRGKGSRYSLNNRGMRYAQETLETLLD